MSESRAHLNSDVRDSLTNHLEPSSRPSSFLVPLVENLLWARTVGGLRVPLGELRSPSAGVQAEVFAGERPGVDCVFRRSVSFASRRASALWNVFGASALRGSSHRSGARPSHWLAHQQRAAAERENSLVCEPASGRVAPPEGLFISWYIRTYVAIRTTRMKPRWYHWSRRQGLFDYQGEADWADCRKHTWEVMFSRREYAREYATA